MRNFERHAGAVLDAFDRASGAGGFEDLLLVGDWDWPGSPTDVDELAAWDQRISAAERIAAEMLCALHELHAELGRVNAGEATA